MPLTQSYPSMFWQQFHDENGEPLANGTVKTFLASDHSMPVQTYTYPGSGVLNPTNITLDDAGKCVMALEIGLAYYIEVYDVNNNLKGTFDNVTAGSGTGEGGNLTFTSSDGSITITRIGDTVDLTVVKDTDIYGTVEGYETDSSGIILFSRVVDGDIILADGNIGVDPHKLYHLTVHLDFSNVSAGTMYENAKLVDSEAHEHMFTVDQSMEKNYVEVSFDMVPSESYISLQLVNTGSTLSSARVYIHRVNPIVGSNSGGGGGTVTDVTVNGTSVVSSGIARVTVPTKTSDLTNDSGFITANDIPQQVQADWNQSNTSADDYIKNKPSNLVQDASYVHTDNNFTTALKDKLEGIEAGADVNVQSDWNQSNTSADDYIKNKPTNLVQDASYVHTDNNFTTTLKNKLDGIQAGAEVNVQSDWNESDSSDPAYIKNKPTIPSGQDLVPSHSVSDSGKVLGVNASGTTEWVTAGGGGVGTEVVRVLSSNITTQQDYDDIVSEFTTKEVYIKPDTVELDYNAYFRVIKANSTVIVAELPVADRFDPDLTGQDAFYIGIIQYRIQKTSGGSLSKWPSYHFTTELNRQTFGINLYDPRKTYKQNEFVFLQMPRDVNNATWVYRAREDLPANVDPSMYPAAWQRLSLEDFYRQLKKVSVTPDNGTLELLYIYESRLLESTDDIQTIDSYEGIESVIIQWTVDSYTTLPTVPSSWHASSSNPSSLTVGRTYQLRLVNNCYTIEEFI